MKRTALFLCFFLSTQITTFSQALEAELLVKIHHANTSDMNAIAGVDTGSLIFNIDSSQLFEYTGSRWQPVDFSKIQSMVSKKDSLYINTRDTTFKTRLYVSADSLNGAIFPIWAEESGALAANAFEWAYGNGDDSQAGFGIVVPIECELFAVGLTVFDGSGEVEVYVNGAATGKKSGTATAADVAFNTLDIPVLLRAGDVVNFRTTAAAGANSGGKAVAWLKKVLKVPNFERHNGQGIPNPTLGRNFDEYLDIQNGDLYIKELGAWVFKTNLRGPTGSADARAYIQMTNTLSTNININATRFSWLDTTMTNLIQDTSSVFTKDTDGIRVNQTGVYRVTVYQHQSTTVQRSNAGLQIGIDNVAQAGIGANAYIRSASGHNESTASLSRLVRVSAGQKITIINQQLALGGTVTCPAGTLVFLVEQI